MSSAAPFAVMKIKMLVAHMSFGTSNVCATSAPLIVRSLVTAYMNGSFQVSSHQSSWRCTECPRLNGLCQVCPIIVMRVDSVPSGQRMLAGLNEAADER